MTVCVDFLQTSLPKKKSFAKYGNQWCHLFADDDDLEALHLFALSLGLKRSYFQDHRLLRHYDLTPAKRALAINLGATEK